MLNNYVFPAEIATRLRKNVKGALFTDLANRGRYATDASIYQQFPLAVLIPEDAEDVKTALAVAAETSEALVSLASLVYPAKDWLLPEASVVTTLRASDFETASVLLDDPLEAR